jgi:hypothetical protein
MMNEQNNNTGGQEMEQQQQSNTGQNYGGQQQAPYQGQHRDTAQALRKSAALATWFSLMPGMGQVYVGYYQKGFSYLATVAVVIAMLNLGLPDAMTAMLGIFLGFFWIFNMIDANRRANHFNRAMSGLDTDSLPEEFEMPSSVGSIPLGVILVVVGVLVILDLNFSVSLAWLEDWWPLSLVGFGGWLIMKGRQGAK